MDTILITDTLGRILTSLTIPFSGISVADDGPMLRVNVDCPQPSRLIGWHGETLNAVQHILKSMLRTQLALEKAPFIVLDVDGYRTMQEEKVRQIAQSKAEIVKRTGARVALSPMSPYFRRVVHTFIAETPSLSDMTTESVGEGDYRQVVLRLKHEVPTTGESSEELSPVMNESDGLENLDI